MAGPWDFSFRPQAMPSESLLRGAALGGGLVDAFGQGQQIGQQRIAFQQEQDDRAMKLQLEQAQRQKLAAEAAQFKADQERFAADPFNLDVAHELAIKYPKVYGSPDFKAQFDRLDKANQQQTFDEFARVLAAISAGKPDIAVEDLSTAQVAFEDAGKTGEAKSRAMLAEMIQRDPVQARAWLTGKLASIADKDQIANLGKLDTRAADALAAQAAADKAVAEAEKEEIEADKWDQKMLADIGLTEEQTRDLIEKRKLAWANLSWEREKFRKQLELDMRELGIKERDLPSDSRKAVAESLMQSRVLEDRANKSIDLANKFEGLPLITRETGGVFTTASEKAQDIVGIQAEEKKLNDDYEAIVEEIATARLKAAGETKPTDSDRAAARKGMPSRTAKPEVKARFLRENTGVLADAARRERFDAQYVAENRDAGTAKGDLDLDGVIIPAGTPAATAYTTYKTGLGVQRAIELRRAGKKPEEVRAQMKMEGF